MTDQRRAPEIPGEIPGTETPGTVAAWDGPTRLFHWLLAAFVLCAWFSAEFSSAIGDRLMVWHRWNGLALLVLVVWRILWGLFGPAPARFRAFVQGPAAALRYARQLRSGASARYLGHNPLGALMILALLAALLMQATLGLFATDDNDLTGGPLHRLVSEHLNDRATGWHGRIFHFVLLPLVALHIAANALYGVLKREPLISAMITGRKPAGEYIDASAHDETAHSWRTALFCLGAAVALVFGAILAAGGRLT